MNKKIVQDCEETISHLNIVLREKKSIYKAINSEHKNVSKYKVDGCIYGSGSVQTRCDYLLKDDDNLYFIELKGSDIKKGLDQILKSINQLSRFFDYSILNARIITTRGTAPKRLNTYKEYRDLLKLIGTESLIISNTPFQEHLN